MKLKKSIILYSLFTMLFVNIADAARFGGGKSRGFQRSFSGNNLNYKSRNNNAFNRSNNSNQNNNNFQNNSTNTSGMSATKAAVVGALAGAAGGYMLGKSSNQNNTEQNINKSEPVQNSIASQNNVSDINAATTSSQVINNTNETNNNIINQNTASDNNKLNNPNPINNANTSNINNTNDTHTNNALSNIINNNIPIGIILILLLLLGIGLMFFRKKIIDDPILKNNNQNKPKNINQATMQNKTSNNVVKPDFSNEKMPDGIEQVYFLRQVKGMFLHIQSMNNKENMQEIAKYLTPELYNEIQADIENNQTIADFSKLNCQLLNAEKINDTIHASVEFFGLVSDEPNMPHQDFYEVWNFIKSDATEGKWLIAGIKVNNSKVHDNQSEAQDHNTNNNNSTTQHELD